jgi:hypothetical protein
MRILIAGQPKTGNVWARKLFSQLYRLDDLNESLGRVPENVPTFLRFVEHGSFKENSVFHSHLFPNPKLRDACEGLGCNLITMLRNPYDAFVSFYFYVNRLAERFHHGPFAVIIGKPIDHPDVLEFVRTEYLRHLNLAVRWVNSGKAIVIRYEDLHARPVETIRDVADRICPVEDDQIRSAVEQCQAEKLKRRGGWIKGHIRSATTGNWEEHLGPAHFEAFKESSADLIIRLGYGLL